MGGILNKEPAAANREERDFQHACDALPPLTRH